MVIFMGVIRNWSENARLTSSGNLHSNMLYALRPDLFRPHTSESRTYDQDHMSEGQTICMRTIRFFHHMILVPGQTHLSTATAHRHDEAEEIFYIIKGVGDFQLGEKTYRVKSGDVVYIPPYEEHLLTNLGPEPLEFIDFNVPVGEALKKLTNI